MLRRLALASMATLALGPSLGFAQSPNGVRTLDPPGAIKAEGTWSLGARAGDFVFVAGMQGVDPATIVEAKLAPDMLPLRFQIVFNYENSHGYSHPRSV